MSKDLWNTCEIIAEKLNDFTSDLPKITKYNVNKYLYNYLYQNNLINGAVEGNQEILKHITESDEFKKFKEIATLGTVIKPKSEPAKSAADKLKIGMWFIEKIGSFEEAIKILNAAGVALKSLDNK